MEGDVIVSVLYKVLGNFNPRPPWGGRQACNFCGKMISWISIHALRGEGDRHCGEDSAQALSNFNPRPPWGGRPQAVAFAVDKLTFQSTPSVGRATAPPQPHGGTRQHFNPRPPWGGRLKPWHLLCDARGISIHALRGEGDAPDSRTPTTPKGFQSTPSVGRATIFG